MKATVHVATSVDGFIAREDGDLDWLHGAASGSGGEDYGYKAFIETVDAIVMGRHTYEKVRTFDKWPYDRPVVPVLIGRGIPLFGSIPGDILLRHVETRQFQSGVVQSEYAVRTSRTSRTS